MYFVGCKTFSTFAPKNMKHSKIKIWFRVIKRIVKLRKARKSDRMTLTFKMNEADRKWYVQLGWWPFKKDHLEMVAGSADFLDMEIEERTPRQNWILTLWFYISFKKEEIPNTYECELTSSSLLKGAFYKVDVEWFKPKIFLCPVALFIFGHYPKYIYIEKQMYVRGHGPLKYYK